MHDFIHLLLTVLALPQYINTHKFLVNIEKHDLQRIYESKEVLPALRDVTDLFSDFVGKFEIWQNLEQQHDIRADQLKAQKKVEEIYESLKKAFNNEPDEKQE